MSQLGKLVKVDLRSVWKHEATDFSAWLVQPENLDVLAEQLGIDFERLFQKSCGGCHMLIQVTGQGEGV